MNKITSCRKCDLYNNQLPLLDSLSKSDVMWVGLSAKKVRNGYATPLSNDTISGGILNRIETELQAYTFYKTNLVKCLPLSDNKLRYPNKNECEACFDNLTEEINHVKPKVVVMLGKLVAKFIINKLDFVIENTEYSSMYKIYHHSGVCYIHVLHPSYIYVYKRSQVNPYVNELKELIKYHVKI